MTRISAETVKRAAMHAAFEAGLGIPGKIRLLITLRFGPRQLLAAVITDAQLKPDRKFTEKEAGIAWEKCNDVIKPHNSMYGYSACCDCMIACLAGSK